MLHACSMPSRDSLVARSRAPLKKTSFSSMNAITFLRATSTVVPRRTPAAALPSFRLRRRAS